MSFAINNGANQMSHEFLISFPAFNLTDKSDKLPMTFVFYRKSHFLVSNETSEKQKSEMVESLVVSATIQGKRIESLKNPVVARFRLPPVS